jgi:hypothetical protein
VILVQWCVYQLYMIVHLYQLRVKDAVNSQKDLSLGCYIPISIEDKGIEGTLDVGRGSLVLVDLQLSCEFHCSQWLLCVHKMLLGVRTNDLDIEQETAVHESRPLNVRFQSLVRHVVRQSFNFSTAANRDEGSLEQELDVVMPLRELLLSLVATDQMEGIVLCDAYLLAGEAFVSSVGNVQIQVPIQRTTL